MVTPPRVCPKAARTLQWVNSNGPSPKNKTLCAYSIVDSAHVLQEQGGAHSEHKSRRLSRSAEKYRVI